MLIVTIPGGELFDEETQEFIELNKGSTLKLEHSLVSISKWESKWHKPFLSNENKSVEETIDYIKCMTITQNVPEDVYSRIPTSVLDKVNDYIKNPMTATWFSEDDKKKGNTKGEIVTSEIIYYWMVALQIPMECQTWHLNRLLTLIRVCNVKNQPPKKMKKKEILSRNATLNEARKKRLHTKG